MEIEYRNNIYDRLLEIRFKMGIEVIPDPVVINQKIGECHIFIEEIEHFSIKVSKEISVMQQAYNNAVADYEIKKESLLTKDPIKSLPSIKDREAQANLALSTERSKVVKYENEVIDLNNLLKSINLKIKNLNRANNDIKMQLRIFEAQAKIGGIGPSTNYAAKSLMEELEKSTLGEDAFEEAEAGVEEEEKIVDPSSSLDVESLLDGKEEPRPSEEEMAEKLIDPVPDLSPDTDGESPIEIEDDWPVIDQETVLEVEKVIEAPEPENKEINLDAVIDTNEEIIKQEGGKEEKTQIETQTKVEVVENQKERHTVETGMDIDDLLDSFQPTKN
jgi:hypothetical protein